MGKFNLNQILNDASKRAAPGGGGQTAPASRPAQIERLSVYDLVPSEDNFYSMNDIEELKSKIELAGRVLQNFIVVSLGGGKYKVISGHRRRLASIALVEEGKPEYEFVPCTIEDSEEDAEVQAIREEIMLIAANSQREKTAWDKIEEVRRTRAILERVKRQEKLPGDMRKIVAQTLHTSPAQIGRFDAIIRNLCPEFMGELKADRINISTAYELSGLSAEEQKAAFDLFVETGEISIRDARGRKKDPPPAQQKPEAQAKLEEPPAARLNAPQKAAETPETYGKEEAQPAAETPAEGRTEQKKRQEETGGKIRQLEQLGNLNFEAEPGSVNITYVPKMDFDRAAKQLESLLEYCMNMGESFDHEQERDWTADVNALYIAISRLEECGE